MTCVGAGGAASRAAAWAGWAKLKSGRPPAGRASDRGGRGAGRLGTAATPTTSGRTMGPPWAGEVADFRQKTKPDMAARSISRGIHRRPTGKFDMRGVRIEMRRRQAQFRNPYEFLQAAEALTTRKKA